MRNFSDRPSARTAGLVLLGVLSAIFIVLLVVLVVKTKHDASIAEAEAAHYRPPALAAATPALPLVSVISDGLSVAPTGSSPWTTTAGKALKVSITPLAIEGSGYTTAGTSTAAAPTTFVQRASTVDSGSKVVVFFGGAADSTASPTAVRNAAIAALAAAHATAPKAKLVVMGPGWPSAKAPAAVRQVSSALYQAAAHADAAWVDPLAAKWLSSSSGLVAANGTTLTAAGEKVVATQVQQALQPVLTDAG